MENQQMFLSSYALKVVRTKMKPRGCLWLRKLRVQKTSQEIAEEHIRDIGRLREFAKQFTGERQLILGFTGHGLNADALAVYLANKGEVTEKGFEKIGGTMIGQGEIGSVEIEGDRAVFKYRDKKYEVPKGLIDESAKE